MNAVTVTALTLTCLLTGCVTVSEPPPAAQWSAQASQSMASPPRILQRPVPYPPQARGERGKVTLQVMVTPQGRAGDRLLLRSSGSSLLDQAALEALDNWRFHPAIDRDGEPMPMQMIIPITLAP